MLAETALVGHLRSDVGLDEAVDVLWTYTSADLYRLLVADAAWAHPRYVAWLRRTLEAALL